MHRKTEQKWNKLSAVTSCQCVFVCAHDIYVAQNLPVFHNFYDIMCILLRRLFTKFNPSSCLHVSVQNIYTNSDQTFKAMA